MVAPHGRKFGFTQSKGRFYEVSIRSLYSSLCSSEIGMSDRWPPQRLLVIELYIWGPGCMVLKPMIFINFEMQLLPTTSSASNLTFQKKGPTNYFQPIPFQRLFSNAKLYYSRISEYRSLGLSHSCKRVYFHVWRSLSAASWSCKWSRKAAINWQSYEQSCRHCCECSHCLYLRANPRFLTWPFQPALPCDIVTSSIYYNTDHEHQLTDISTKIWIETYNWSL